MKVTTASRTVYEFEVTPTTQRVRRLGGDALRRDGDWLTFAWGAPLEVGANMVLLLEPLGEGDVTVRTTNVVVSIDGA